MTAYTIHRKGTPVLAFPNHPSYWASEYWSNANGWGHKHDGDVYSAEERQTMRLPDGGEWIEILIEQR